MTISLIAAVADNGVIGLTGTVLPWQLSADLKRFKELTMGHPIIMGRKTYETIGRPLPGRLNIIITHNKEYIANGCTVVGSLEAAIDIAKTNDPVEVFIIGGATIFEAGLSIATKIYLTEAHAEPEGDTYFNFDKTLWRETFRETFPSDEKNQYPYSFVTLETIKN